MNTTYTSAYIDYRSEGGRKGGGREGGRVGREERQLLDSS